MNKNIFDRPLIIVGAPRSGSTLLFETLCQAKDLWSIGKESHGVFEHIQKFNPMFNQCQSNRLQASDADANSIIRIKDVFQSMLINRKGVPFHQNEISPEQIRFIEKTPKNSLRILFLNKIFPDALFIYLQRDVNQNLSSMIEAWYSGNFSTYPQLPHWPEQWSLLLPPGYGALDKQPIEEIVAYQWHAANNYIMDDLSNIDSNRWTCVSYLDLIEDTPKTIKRLCEFGEIEFDNRLENYCRNQLPLSQYTGTVPNKDKWKKNKQLIEKVTPRLKDTIFRINKFVHSKPDKITAHKPYELSSHINSEKMVISPIQKQSRNSLCHCRSGLRFKHCHGSSTN